MRTRIHGRKISSGNSRKNLTIRAEPYWSHLGKPGRAIGYRKNKTHGSWIARWTEPEKAPDATRPKYRQKDLGAETHDFGYEAALAAANDFFTEAEREWKLARRGVDPKDVRTVADACRVYVEKLRKGKATLDQGERAAARTETLFKAHVYDATFGRIQLNELESFDVETWRDSMVTPTRAKNTVNRIYRSFKAAMNHAFKRRLIASDAAWRAVDAFPVQDGRRDVYLTMEQRRALLAACDRPKTPKELEADTDLHWTNMDLGDFLRGLLLIGARPSELASARVSDFDARAKTLSLTHYKGKKGTPHTRAFPLDDPAALAFFTKMAKDKLPGAYLLTRADGSSWANDNGTLRQYWASGIRGARKLANVTLKREDRIPGSATAYSMRHSKITDWLEAGETLQRVAAVTGTSIAMIEKNYFKYIRHGAQSKLAAVVAF